MYINVNDSIQLASKLTLKRIKNAYQVYSSFQKSKGTRNARIQGLPISLSIEPTTSCNLRCPECPSGLRSFTRPTGRLNPMLFQKIIDELHSTLCYLIFYFQGEPYLHADLFKMIAYASQKKIYTATSTNAHFLDDALAKKTVESGLDRLIISIDGASQETYAAYRKTGKLEKVLDGTRNVLKWKKKLGSRTPHVVWQFLVVKPNEHEMPRMRQLAAEYGVDHLAFKTAQVYDYENGNPLIPTDEKYSRYQKTETGRYELKNAMTDECWKMWHSCVITWDGKVVPCCFDKDAHHQMGDASDTTFGEIWNSEPYQDFREQLLHSRSSIEMCKNCTEGTKVWT